MSAETDTPYDRVPYPGDSHDDTHPTRLSATAAFYGMNPAPVAGCRVLELGCSFGGNIIPMAYQYPESRFIGVDLSSRAIEQGKSTIAVLGLKNIELKHCSITDVTAEFGLFDYIISHGVYSWVPDAVRDKMLATFSENLAPRGVAYVSYNAFPGSHLRDLARDMMLFHVRNMTDPQQRIEQGRAILTFLSGASPKDDVHGAILRIQLKHVEEMEEMVLFHDDLFESSKAFLLHQVVANARRHHLQYLSDAQPWRGDLERYSEPVRDILNMFAERDFMERDQYQDFIDGYAFRRTLFCHEGIRLERTPQADIIRRFYLGSAAAPPSDGINLGDHSAAEFKTPGGGTVTLNHPLGKAALVHLGRCWPASIGFVDVLAGAERLVAAADPTQEHASDEDVQALTEILFRLACRGRVSIQLDPPRLTTTISERPQASLYARKQVASQTRLTNLLHRTTMIEGEVGRQFLMLLDGTRDIDQLVVDLLEALSRAGHQADPPVTRDSIEHHLKILAHHALLIA